MLSAMAKVFCILIGLFLILSQAQAFGSEQASSGSALRSNLNADFSFYSDQQLADAQDMLKQSLLFYNSSLRHPTTGQYLDAVSLCGTCSRENNSSVAATGMGLISLALADASGVLPDARKLAEQTLSFILSPSFSKRSQKGWFRHWFNADNGSDNSGSVNDGYSTIDTAILAAGAVISAQYFSAQGQDPDQVLKKYSDQLLKSVQWSSAISSAEYGTQFLTFDLKNETPRGQTAKFNEYVLVSCMGRLAEQRQGMSGPMTNFWNRHFSNPDSLPQKTYYGPRGRFNLLTDYPLHFLSSFTVQFAYYLCGAVNQNAGYMKYFKAAMQSDFDWFSTRNGQRSAYWGLGAGQALNSTYAANSIDQNNDMIVSPHIVAGFLPVNPNALSDLLVMRVDRTCVYGRDQYEFLWRCSLTQPSVRLNRVQAIDFSSTFLGLAVVHPNIGQEFYRRFSP